MPYPLAAALILSMAGAAQLAPPLTEGTLRSLSLVAEADELGCRAVRGEFVVLLRPELGALILASWEFPGAEQLGFVDGSHVRFSFPGTRMREFLAATDAPATKPAPIWGMAVREVHSPRSGCFALDELAGVAQEPLRSRVRALAAEVVPFLEELSQLRVAPRFDSRTVVFEVQIAGGLWRRVDTREGVPLALATDGTPRGYTVVPVISDPGDGVLLLISVVDESPASAEGRPSRMAHTLEPGRADLSLGAPPMRIRVREVIPPK